MKQITKLGQKLKTAKCVFQTTVIALCTIYPSIVMAGDWTFKTAEEDWGETCFAETRVSGFGILGLMGAKGGEIVAYLSSKKGAVPTSAIFQFRFDDGSSLRVTGGTNDYFGHFELDASAKIIEMLSKGKKLSISGVKLKSVDVSLIGSSASIMKVQQCLN